MTVYVDNFRMYATISNVRGRWSHLTADSHDELHAFAAQLGLQRTWFQQRCKMRSCDPCPHWHYDIVDSKRQKAIQLGAKAVDIRELGAIIRARRARITAQRAGQPADIIIFDDPIPSPGTPFQPPHEAMAMLLTRCEQAWVDDVRAGHPHAHIRDRS